MVLVIQANYSILCQPVDYSFDNPIEMEVSVAIYCRFQVTFRNHVLRVVMDVCIYVLIV